MLNVKVDIKEIENLLKDAPDQVNFAASYAINVVANKAIEAERKGINERYHIKKSWVLKGVDFTSSRATKKKLIVTVGVLPDRNFLGYGEEGTTDRGPLHGAFQWIPNKDVFGYRTVDRNNALYPTNLHFDSNGKGNNDTFMLKLHTGMSLVLQRVKGVTASGRKRSNKAKVMRGRNADTGNRVIWTLVRRTTVPAILRFTSTVEGVVQAQWSDVCSIAVAEALRTRN